MEAQPRVSGAEATGPTAAEAGEAAAAADELLSLFDGASALWLDWIEEEAGPGSPVLQLCREVWRERMENARVSLRHGDVRNASQILHRGLTLLAHGPQILARKELTLEELGPLLRGF